MVFEDRASDVEDVGALGAVFGGEEHVDEVVVFPALGGIYAREDLLSVAEFGSEGVVGFALPGVFVEFLHELISVECHGRIEQMRKLEERYETHLLSSSGSLLFSTSEMLMSVTGCASLEDLGTKIDSCERKVLELATARPMRKTSTYDAKCSGLGML